LLSSAIYCHRYDWIAVRVPPARQSPALPCVVGNRQVRQRPDRHVRDVKIASEFSEIFSECGPLRIATNGLPRNKRSRRRRRYVRPTCYDERAAESCDVIIGRDSCRWIFRRAIFVVSKPNHFFTLSIWPCELCRCWPIKTLAPKFVRFSPSNDSYNIITTIGVCVSLEGLLEFPLIIYNT